MKVGIIGAGPAGLSTAVALKARGIAYEIVDAGRQAGGIWDIGRDETPIYDAAHFISSRTQSGFPGFPMPESYPDYPRHDQVLNYIKAYAVHHGLDGDITFDTRVERVIAEGERWLATLSDGSRRSWDALVVATGVTWHPNQPQVPGTFDGEQMHAFYFKSPDVFRGKRVLIVGGGNSAADIACEAARTASRAFISMRRGYYFVPKYIFGRPTDVFAHSGPSLPPWLEEKVFGFLMNHLVVGDLTTFGLPRPDHPILRSHPILNSQVLHYLGHGDLAYRPDVRALAGDRVCFVDGRDEAIDLIVWATGYQRKYPFLPDTIGTTRLDLYLELFDRSHATRFFPGLFETDGAAYDLFALQGRLIAAYMHRRASSPGALAAFDLERASARPNLRGRRTYIDSLRHTYYVKNDVYKKALVRALSSL
ncbi:MAG: flavin-containing monooxygenase [Vicinamibacterales bacterium]